MPSFPYTFGSGPPDPAGSYAKQFAALLPPGRLWNLEQDSTLQATLAAMADEFERIRLRGANLIDETDPRTATETIADWERMVGLPDERVTTIASAIEDRRVAVTQKVVAQGGQNYQYFSDLCAACGWPLVSISKNPLLRVGFRVGARCYGETFAYSLTLTLGTPATHALAKADFERVIRHVTHSHITDVFIYT